MRDMSTLAYTSFVSVLADIVLIGIVVLFSPVSRSVQEAGGLGTVMAHHWIDARVFIGLGVLSTAMACQHSAFLIANSLTHPTPHRWSIVTQSSLVIAGFLSIALGLIGYLGFLEHTQGDILNNLEKDSTYVNAARGLLALTMVFTYPMESFVARHVLGQLWLGSASAMEQHHRYLLTIVLYIGSLVPALMFHDLGLVLSLTGSLGASAVAYIGPGMVYLGINGRDFVDWVQDRKSTSMDETAGSAIGGEVELPVAGDGTAMMQMDGLDSAGSSHWYRKKPWWWWPLAMPVWVAIANRGARGTNAFLADYQPPTPSSEAILLVLPDRGNYIVACLFIAFGVVAAVCGLISNIYVQINDIFFTP
jgi:Transmembrane amino acid transporter protein